MRDQRLPVLDPGRMPAVTSGVTTTAHAVPGEASGVVTTGLPAGGFPSVASGVTTKGHDGGRFCAHFRRMPAIPGGRHVGALPVLFPW